MCEQLCKTNRYKKSSIPTFVRIINDNFKQDNLLFRVKYDDLIKYYDIK